MTLTTDIKVLNLTSSLCSICKRGVEAEIVEKSGSVFLRKTCPDHGTRVVLLASDAEWYHETMSYPAQLVAPKHAKNEVKTGCPYDCGACASHQQTVYLPVIPITSVCNLDCPICYTINKNHEPFHISHEEFSQILGVIQRNDPDMKIINLTGGEPTLHPDLPGIVRLCHQSGIHRVTISTHGLAFIKNERLLEELAELRARIVLSFDSFDDAVNRKMLGASITSAKMKVLDQLGKYNVDTTLIPVLALGVNDQEVGALVDLALEREHIRSLEIHTMTFTGQGGTDFEPGSRITVPDVIKSIEHSSGGKIRLSDFVPSPCAHPMCYQTCYLLNLGDSFLPFARFMSKPTIRHLLTDNLYMEPGEKMETALQDVINELWTSEIPQDTADSVLRALKNLIGQLFPTRPIPYHEQQIIAERSAKTIYIHSHMDEENFDTDRIRQCCVGVPSADGGNIPTCSYNILYRGRDPRFSQRQHAPLDTFPGGRKW